MKRQQWNRIEQGANTKRATLDRIAEALELPVSVVLDWAGYKLPGGSRWDNDAAQLSAYFNDLPAKGQAHLLAIAKTLWQEYKRPTPPAPLPDDPFADLFQYSDQWAPPSQEDE
jgi:hypothetical protein